MLYALLRNGTEAAKRANYSPKTAYSQAERLLRNAEVQRRIAELEAQFQTKFEAQVERLVQELACVALADIAEVVDWVSCPGGESSLTIRDAAELPKRVTSAVAEITQTQHGLRIKMHNKIAAIELLGRHLGLFKEREATQVPSVSDVADRLREALQLPAGSDSKG